MIEGMPDAPSPLPVESLGQHVCALLLVDEDDDGRVDALLQHLIRIERNQLLHNLVGGFYNKLANQVIGCPNPSHNTYESNY